MRKKILANELIVLVYGEEEAVKAKEASHALLISGSTADMPSYELAVENFADSVIDILSLVHKSGLCGSRFDARRSVEQGGVSVDSELVKDTRRTYTKECLSDEEIIHAIYRTFLKTGFYRMVSFDVMKKVTLPFGTGIC